MDKHHEVARSHHGLEKRWTLQNTFFFVFLMYHTYLVHLYLYYRLLYMGIYIYIYTIHVTCTTIFPSTVPTLFRPEATNNDLPIFFGCFRGERISTNQTAEAMRVLDLCALDLFGWSETKRSFGLGDDGG